MTAIVCTGLLPLLVAAVAWLRLDRRPSAPSGRGRRLAASLPARLDVLRLTDEIARRGARGRRLGSDAALRRRHLAAVLPADARR